MLMPLAPNLHEDVSGQFIFQLPSSLLHSTEKCRRVLSAKYSTTERKVNFYFSFQLDGVYKARL